MFFLKYFKKVFEHVFRHVNFINFIPIVTFDYAILELQVRFISVYTRVTRKLFGVLDTRRNVEFCSEQSEEGD